VKAFFAGPAAALHTSCRLGQATQQPWWGAHSAAGNSMKQQEIAQSSGSSSMFVVLQVYRRWFVCYVVLCRKQQCDV
jgi:hypothetical protein